MTTALVCIALLLLFGLGFGVSMMRGRTGRIVGCSDDPADPLHKWVRAHGNHAEYAPYLALLMLVLALRSPATWVLWCMIVVTASRFLIAAGILISSSLARPHPLRFLGAIGTYLGGAALCVAVFLGL